MYRDEAINNNITGNAEITADKNSSVSGILLFIDRRIAGFRQYYFNSETYSERENYISDILVQYFNSWLREEKQDYLPFNFGKNPAQIGSAKEMDIGVRMLSTQMPTSTLIEFEAKRLSESSNQREYVRGDRGGIERLKRGLHGSHLSVCGMFGYVQSRTIMDWIAKINSWIANLAKDNKDDTINWSHADEKLVEIATFESAFKYKSINKRLSSADLTIYHYFINLVS